MSVELVMPKSGLTMIEGLISEWKVEEGSLVKKGDVVLEFENEKTIIECESNADGYIHLVAGEGDVVAVGDTIALIAATKEIYDSICSGTESGNSLCPNECEECHKQELVEKAMSNADVASSNKPVSTIEKSSGRVSATGLAKSIAKNANVDYRLIQGTGNNGRIVAKDVYDHIEIAKSNASNKIELNKEQEEITQIPLSSLRKAISNSMCRSLREMAQATATVELDVTDLFELRASLVEKQDILGCKITINDLLVMASVKMLKKHPLLNAMFDGEVISTYPYVDVAVAVGAESGLVVPVLRRADKLSLVEMSKKLKDLVVRSREGRLENGEQTNATFTVSNVGMFPIDSGTPIANAPQVGLMAFGRPVKKLVEYNGEFTGRTMMNLMFTFDHRVLDGLDVGNIMQDMKNYIEMPELILV